MRLYPLSLLSAALLAAGCSSNGYDGDSPPPPPANQAPVVSAIADVTVAQDTVIGPLTFSVMDESDVANLNVSASASTNTLFPADGIAVGGAGGARTLTLTPFEAVSGTAVITVTVRDPTGMTTLRTFNVAVTARAASVRDTTLTTFAKVDGADPTPVNGFTFTQDADDPAAFAALIPADAP